MNIDNADRKEFPVEKRTSSYTDSLRPLDYVV